MKVEEIQKDLDGHKRRIRFKADKKFKNFKEVINFATDGNYNNDNSSTYMRGGIQCCRARSRGTSDIYRLCKFYFPDTKLKDVLEYLKDGHFYRHMCAETRQQVFNKIPAFNMKPYYKSELYVRLRTTSKPVIVD